MITIAVPYKGRGLEQTLDRLVEIGMVDENARDFYVNIVQEDKKRMSQEREQIEESSLDSYSSNADIERKLQEIKENSELAFDLKVDYDLQRKDQPARIFFKGLETEFNGIKIRLVGKSHYETPTALRNHEVQMAFVGWDELYADHIEHFDFRSFADWCYMNKYLREDSTDVRVLGSAGFDDFTGHFVMIDESIAKRIACVWDDINVPTLYDENLDQIGIEKGWCGPVHVDHKYQKLYESLLSCHWKDHFKGTEDVEDSIKESNGVGIYVVQTGDTVKKKNLHLIGLPLLVSETVIAVNVADFIENPDLVKLADVFGPHRQTNYFAMSDYFDWYEGLREKLGENYKWVDEFGEKKYVPGSKANYGVQRPDSVEPYNLVARI